MLTPAAALLSLVTLALPAPPPALAKAVGRAEAALVARHGAAEQARAARGVRQAASLWRPADGDAAAFEAFALAQFAASGAPLDTLFGRLESALETLDGHTVEIGRGLGWWTQIDTGPMAPVDPLLATYDPGAHVQDDLFATKVAFVALLNFPLTTLQERLVEGPTWTRRQWAEARLAGRFARRVPAEVSQGIANAAAAADLYVAGYNIWAHHLLDGTGARPFEKGKRLLSHWNLRDELKAQYAQEGGLERQRMLATVMERIVTQTIPADVIDDPTVDWNPLSNVVMPAQAPTIEQGSLRGSVEKAREPDTRYAQWLAGFQAVRAADPYSPSAPTHLARKFELERELPEARVVALLEEVLGAPEVKRVAALVQQRLGRPLEAHDLWYDGFRPRARFTEADLDARTKARWPTAAAFEKDLPVILGSLGFSPTQAAWLAERIAVDPARGSGHAAGAARRGDKARLRTRVGADGMDYKGFNIAVHELGHNVEQTYSLYQVDSTLLQGVPNTAFTEAIAFVFQARDLEVLGLGAPDAEARRLLALNDLWMTWEISGVGLVDIQVWRWMYAHPKATPAELREAALKIARDVWNRWYAPVLGVRDSPLLAIYSHLIHSFLYVPDYALGHLISSQIEEHLSAQPPGRLGAEVERMTTYGAVAPDLWMKHATGAEVSAKPLLRAAARALDAGAAPAVRP